MVVGDCGDGGTAGNEYGIERSARQRADLGWTLGITAARTPKLPTAHRVASSPPAGVDVDGPTRLRAACASSACRPNTCCAVITRWARPRPTNATPQLNSTATRFLNPV